MRVLIVKTSSLGDIVHALPVLDYLHKASPGIEIDWVVEEGFREILEGHPQIAELHLVRTRYWRKHPLAVRTRREVVALRAAMQAREYKLVFDIQGNLKSGLIAWFSGCDHRLGFAEEELQERYNLFFTTRHIPVRLNDRHVTDKCLRVVSVPFGKDFSGMELTTLIATSAEDDSEALALMSTLGEGLVFLFQYGTTWQTKFWSKEGWVALGKTMLERYADSTILFAWGSDAERQAVTDISRSIGAGARVMDRYPLKRLVAILKKMDLVVGGDTGPVHLAAAVGTPTVSFYRSSDGSRSGPRGERHAVIQSPLSCTRCFQTRCNRDQECRESITVDALIDAAARLLALPLQDDSMGYGVL